MKHTKAPGVFLSIGVFGLVCAIGIGAAPHRASAASVLIDGTATGQGIDGFGAYDGGPSNIGASINLTDAQADSLFLPTGNGIGLSLMRISILPNPDPNAPSTWFYDAPNIAKALARGVKVWSSAQQPPLAWMSGGSLIRDYTHYTLYANFLAQYAAEFRNRFGKPLYALSIQNEPNITGASWDCYWSPTDFDVFLKWYLAPAFSAKGIATKIMLPEQFNWDFTDATPSLQDTAAVPFVGIVAAHHYDTTTPAPYSLALNLWKPVWETEVMDDGPYDPGMASALRYATQVQQFMAGAGASAYHYFLLTEYTKTQNEALAYQNSDGTLTYAKRLYALGNFSKFVRPGWYRMLASTSNPSPGVYVSAYRTYSGDQHAIVVVNQNASWQPLNVSFNNATIPSFTPYYTFNNAYGNANLSQGTAFSAGAGFSTWLYPSSVTTFYSGSAVGVSIAANPPSIVPGGTTKLAATITGGTATGPVNYNFWWNCADTAATVLAEQSVCGTLPPLPTTAGTCSVDNGVGMRCFQEPASFAVSHAYSAAGTYTAKVIVGRQGANAEARTPVYVHDFSLTDSGGITTTPGASGSNTVTATVTAGAMAKILFYGPAGLPTGASGKFSATSCAPNCTVTLTITTSASTPPGAYPLTVTATDGGGYVKHSTNFDLIVSSSSADGAQFVSQNVPAAMTVGQSYSVSIMMKNTGTTTWTAANNYKLGSQNPQDNLTWGVGRALLASGDSIAPGQSKAFTFAVTAPATAGSYNFQWEMLREGLAWFGQLTPNLVITVSSPTSPPPPPAAGCVTLSSPASGATVSGTVSVNGAQSCSGFWFWRLLVDGISIGDFSAVPISWNTTGVANGTHTVTLSAQSINPGSVSLGSASVSVNVQNGGTTASPSGTTIPPAAKIIDSANNQWTVSDGVVYKNGSPAGFTANVTLLLWYNSVIYQENSSLLWWLWNGTGWTSVSGDPRSGVTPLPSSSTTPPTVSITSPTNGSSYTVGASVTVLATIAASGNYGIAKTEFYVDNNLLATSAAYPWGFIWYTSGASAGTHILVMKAYDTAGNVGVSAPVSVTLAQ